MATTDLGDFEGLQVVAETLVVRGTGSGLESAMKVDPQHLSQGDIFYVLYECKCIDVQHPFADEKKSEELVVRNQVGRALNATIVPKSQVPAALEATKKKIEKARAEATKQETLDMDYDPLDVDGTKAKTPAKATGAAAKKAPAKKSSAKRAPAKKTPGAKKAAALSAVPDPK